MFPSGVRLWFTGNAGTFATVRPLSDQDRKTFTRSEVFFYRPGEANGSAL
jgi:hypothetical protein